MAIGKKIAWTGLLGIVGVVLYRFGRIIVRVFREEFSGKSAKSRANGE